MAARGDGGQHGESTGSRSYTNTRRAGRQAPGPGKPTTGAHTPPQKKKKQKKTVGKPFGRGQRGSPRKHRRRGQGRANARRRRGPSLFAVVERRGTLP